MGRSRAPSTGSCYLALIDLPSPLNFVKRYHKDWSIIGWFLNFGEVRQSGEALELLKSNCNSFSDVTPLDEFTAELLQVG